MGRKLPKRECPTCHRRIAQLPTRPTLRAHKCEPKPPEFGLIDISIDEGPNRLWYASRTAHKNPRPGDDNPKDWGRATEHDDKAEAIHEAEGEAESLIKNRIAGQVTIFVDGNEHKAY